MTDLANIPQLTRTFVTLAKEDEAFDEHSSTVFDSFATTYRIYCEKSAEIVLDDLDGYPNIQQLFTIERMQDRLDEVQHRHRREALNYYSKWAYRYGAKQADEVTIPESDYRPGKDDPYAAIQLQAEDIIESGEATVNDMALVFRLAYEHHSEYRNDFTGDTELMEFYDAIHNEVESLVEMKSPDINWNMMGGLFRNGSRMADRDCMKEVGIRQGRKEIIEALCEQENPKEDLGRLQEMNYSEVAAWLAER